MSPSPRPSPVLVAVLLAALALLLPPPAFAGRQERLEKDIAARLVRLAGWCERRGLVARAREHLEEALLVAPGDEAAARLRLRLAEERPVPGDAEAAYAKEREKAAKVLARLYLSLFAEPHEPAAQAAFDGHLLRALAWDPAAARETFETAWRDARAAGDLERVERLLASAPDGETNEEIRSIREEAALRRSAAKPILRQAKTHPIRYWLSLPPAWTKERSWPVLVTADGAGSSGRRPASASQGSGTGAASRSSCCPSSA